MQINNYYISNIARFHEKTTLFTLSLQLNVDENLKNKTEFITKNNEFLAGNKIKNKTEQLLLKYLHGNDIHEHRKQQNKWAI